jgi:hypothetical protein
MNLQEFYESVKPILKKYEKKKATEKNLIRIKNYLNKKLQKASPVYLTGVGCVVTDLHCEVGSFDCKYDENHNNLVITAFKKIEMIDVSFQKRIKND